MKKAFFAWIMLLDAVTLKAANPVKLTNGDAAVFQEEAVAYVEIDDHKTVIDGKNQTADVYYGEKSAQDYENFVADLDRAHESFVAYFNEKRKTSVKLTMTGEKTDSVKYVLKVNVSSMNVGNAGGMVWGMSRKAGGALINGTMQLVDNATGSVVCEFEFKGVKGLLSPVFKARAISVYRYLADGLLKAVQ